MKIYEFLGIDHLLMDIPIPQDAILENVDAGAYGEAVAAFRNIDYISLRVSLNRDEHYLQVMEIGMNTPRDIDVIAKIIQKTIKYRILFIFTYQEHYLILWRNFKLTDSTEYVYSDGVAYCTDWIYDESLDMDVLWTCNTIKINNDRTRIVPLSFKKKNKNDDDGMAYFRDVVRNVYSVSGAIINRELVCSRYLIDWFACHAIGERVDLNYLLCEAIREEMYMIVDDHIFFEKDRLEVLCSEIENPNYMYKVSMGRTGRIPWTYFESIAFPATYDDEYDIVSRLHEVLESDGQYLVQLLDDHTYDVPAKRETRYTVQRSLVAQAEPPRKSDAQQRREAEYRAAVEQESGHTLEEQRAEEARRKAEEERRVAEERRKAEEEARRKAEEEARRKAAEEEARRKAEEEARRKAEEEARRKAEEEARRKAEEEARRKAEEEVRRKAEEEARRKAEEEARRKAEEEARRKAAEEEARRKAEEEARRKAEEEARRKAEEEKRLAEERRKADAENSNGIAKGMVIDAKLEERGPVATLIVQCGTLREGDKIVIGTVVGRVRTIIDQKKGFVKAAKAISRVKISGLSGVPSIGDTFEIVADVDAARKLAEANRNGNATKAKVETKEKTSTQPTQELDPLESAKKYIGFANNSAYFNWLSAKVSGEFMDEIIKAYEIIQRFAIANRLLNAPLLETTDIVRVRGVQDAVRIRKEFTKLGGNSRYFCGLAMRHYVQYISELEAKQPVADTKAEERRKTEERRLAEDRRKAEEVRRQEEAHRKAEEEARRKAEEEARRKAEEEARRKAEEEVRRKAEEEARRKAAEEARAAEERRKAEARRKEELARLIGNLGILENAKRQDEVRRKEEQIRLLIGVCRQIETIRRQEEAQRQAEEEARRKAEEEARRQAEEEARKKAEHERAVEARRRAIEEHNREEARRRAEEQKQREEAQRKADEARRQEEARLREKEERRKAELLRQQAAEEKRAQYRKNNRCQHCGGEFKSFLGVFAKKCKVCQKPKDY